MKKSISPLGRSTGLGVALLGLLLLEGLLRAFGVGHPTRFFLKKTYHQKTFLTTNPQFGWLFFPPAMAREPLPAFLPLEKPPQAERILVLGESVVRGDPDPLFGFCRLLTLLRQARAPQRPVELVDTGITAINSHAIVEIAKELPIAQPDVVIIYMGNNEVVGEFGPGTVFRPFSKYRGLIRLQLALKKLRISQLMESGFRYLGWETERPWKGLAMFVSHQVPADAPGMKWVYPHFEANLREIIARARGTGARVILCTIATNLRDCAPFGSLHRPGLTADELQRWNAAITTGRDAQARRRWQDALTAYDRADRIDSRFADLQFQRGRCLLTLRRIPEAQAAFSLARDLDTLRFRADSRINEIIRQVGQTEAGVRLMDIDEILRKESPDRLPGMNFFLEHVHPNFDGNFLIARSLSGALDTSEAVKEFPSARVLSWAECARQAGYDAPFQKRILENMLLRLAESPFIFQSNHAEQIRYLQTLRQSLSSRPHTPPVPYTSQIQF